MLPKRILRGLWMAAIVLVVVSSLLPSNSLPIKALDNLGISDKLEHCIAYLVLAILPGIHESRRFITAAALGAVAMGVILEFGQLYSGWRDFEVGDMVADAIGVCVGLAFGISMRSTDAVRSIFSRSSDEAPTHMMQKPR